MFNTLALLIYTSFTTLQSRICSPAPLTQWSLICALFLTYNCINKPRFDVVGCYRVGLAYLRAAVIKCRSHAAERIYAFPTLALIYPHKPRLGKAVFNLLSMLAASAESLSPAVSAEKTIIQQKSEKSFLRNIQRVQCVDNLYHQVVKNKIA